MKEKSILKRERERERERENIFGTCKREQLVFVFVLDRMVKMSFSPWLES